MIRVLHLADLHLGYDAPVAGIAEARRKERDAGSQKAVTWAIQNDIDLVVIAGDLFETTARRRQLVDTAIRELKGSSTAGVGLVTLPGNHDEISYHDSVYRREREAVAGHLGRKPQS